MHLHIRSCSTKRAADPAEDQAEELDRLNAELSDPAEVELARALYPYVQLEFFPSPEAADRLLALAVVFHRNIVPIVMIRQNWQAGLEYKDLEYLAALMDDWERTPSERLLTLFRQLECLSIGPLRTTRSGIVTVEGMEYLMRAVLGQAGITEQWTM